jgi:hypothetical protein
MLVMFFIKANRADIQACSLKILEKGKPVARPGRKAEGRLISAGSLAAERVKRSSASDEERGALLDRDPAGKCRPRSRGRTTQGNPLVLLSTARKREIDFRVEIKRFPGRAVQ